LYRRLAPKNFLVCTLTEIVSLLVFGHATDGFFPSIMGKSSSTCLKVVCEALYAFWGEPKRVQEGESEKGNLRA
jgi:hypothetical protein